MTGWLVAAVIVIVLLLPLFGSAAVRFEYKDKENVRIKISYLFFTLFKFPASKTKKDKKGKKDNDKNKTDKKNAAEHKNKTDNGENSEKSKENLNLSDIFELIALVVNSLSSPLKKLLHRVRILNFRLEIVCGGDDAAEIALKYGKINIAAGTALGYIDTHFTLKKPEISIKADFNSEESTANCSCTVKLRLIAALAFVFAGGFKAIKNYRSNEKAAKAVGKLLAKN